MNFRSFKRSVQRYLGGVLRVSVVLRGISGSLRSFKGVSEPFKFFLQSFGREMLVF